MDSFVSTHSKSIMWSLALHGALVVAMSLGLRFDPLISRPSPAGQIIEATIVDGAAIERELARIEERERVETERRERERQAEVERQRQAEVERERQVQREAEERRQIQMAERREREERERLEREAADEAERQRQAEVRRQEQERLAREQAERERVAAEAAARAQARREAEITEALASEAERARAVNAGLLDQYVSAIESRIMANWFEPPNLAPGLECLVQVTQIPSGDVTSVRVTDCDADAAVIRSIEQAVRRASPLPRPPVPSLFERELNVKFRPDR